MLENFSGPVGKCVEGVDGGDGIGKRNVKRRLLDVCEEKELCVANACGTGGCKIEIDVVFEGKKK